MLTYPIGFPCPQISDYSVDVDMGIVRSELDDGFNAQYRKHKTLPHLISARFVMSLNEYGKFARWFINYAGEWFSMELPTGFTPDGQVTSPIVVRNISPIAMEFVTQDHVGVSMQFEVHAMVTP